MARLAVGLFACGILFAQGTNPPLTFEVASIKPSPPAGPGGFRRVGCNGGPGSTDPGLYNCTNFNISNLVGSAFHLNPYQLPSADYGDNAMYEISAKVPPGTTKEQFDEMLRNLVIERFKLAYHFEKKEMQVYDLTVARGGLKMKESPPADAAPEARGDSADAASARPKPGLQADGYPDVRPPRRGQSSMTMTQGRAKWVVSEGTLERITSMIGVQLGGPVTDSTNLKGKYDFTLSWASGERPSGDDSPAPSLVEAVQEQLGLKIERKKGMVDVFVIDHLEKKPIEN